jgi:hypothetical protein
MSRTAVVDAASVSAGLWLSYLFALFYLLIAAGAVTHKDLFFESPVKLPFLGIDLPLKGFFILGPGLFLIAHTYILLHFSLLAGKVRAFNRQQWKQIGDFETRSDLRRQLPAKIFVQLLAGPSSDRNGVVGAFLWLIATISLVAGPVVLLCFFELQFLPYHDKAISNWHRIAVGLDLVLMWSFWWRVALRSGGPPDGRRLWDRAAIVIQYIGTASVMLGLTGCSAVPMVAIATFDGEDIDTWALRHTWRSAPGPILRLREALVSGDVNPATRAPESLWSNRLVLPGLDVVVHLKLDSETKIDFLPETVSLRARNLDGAVLIDAVLRKVQKAKLECGDWLDPDKREQERESSEPLCAQLQGAALNETELQGASFINAQLQGASLREAAVWRAAMGYAKTANTWIDRIRSDPILRCNEPGKTSSAHGRTRP